MKFLTNFLGLLTALSGTIVPINQINNTNATSILKDDKNLPIDPIEIPKDEFLRLRDGLTFKSKDELYKFYDTETDRIVASMERDFDILKKIVKKNGNELTHLPFKDFTQGLGFSDSDFTDDEKYNFNALSEYWDSFFSGWRDLNYNYKNYLMGQIRIHVKTDHDATEKSIAGRVFSDFSGKQDEQLFLKIVVLDFEVLAYLKLNPPQATKDKIYSVLKEKKGVTTTSPDYVKTLIELQKYIGDIRTELKQNLSLQIAEEEFKKQKELQEKQKLEKELKEKNKIKKQNQKQQNLNKPKKIKPISNQIQQSSLNQGQIAAIAIPSVLIPITAGVSGFSYWWFFKRKKQK